MSKHLITSALPYANGPIHFGHLAGAYIPGDVYYRHLKNCGEETIHICGSDEHGVAIMLNAKKANKNYKEYVDEWHEQHKRVFEKYDIVHDYFGQTSSEYHAEEVKEWFNSLNEKGYIGTKDGEQLFCNDCKNHLPDRFVEGQCYKCDYESARGDECPNCGELIDSIKLINPVCKICDSQNISQVTVTQYYLLMSKFHSEFREWFNSKKDFWRKTVWPYVNSLTEKELVDRAISRDLDWGIDVPLAEAKGKKLYVWFDAPIGYVSNTKEFFKSVGRDDDYINDWWKNDDVKITNFIGKDNIIFHTVIFPMMSMASGKANPVTNVPANQYLNLCGKQFSKSSGWYVDAEEAVDKFGSDAFRYYLINILPDTTDSSFTWEGLQAKVNNELANNIGNLVNRCLKFWAKNWKEGLDAKYFSEFTNSKNGVELKNSIIEHKALLDKVEIRKGLEKVMEIGHTANTFFSDREPWAVFKTDEHKAAGIIAETGIYILCLSVLLKPYLPKLSSSILELYGDKVTDEIQSKIYNGDFSVIDQLFSNGYSLTGKPKALVPKIEDDVINELNEQLKEK